jgi:putative toxin-antitoxin system antitoxin component (TIGR02293 family)
MERHLGIIPEQKEEYSMSGLPVPVSISTRTSAGRSFTEFRSGIDQRVLQVFRNKAIRRSLKDQGKVNLSLLWIQTVRALEQQQLSTEPALAQADIHRAIVEGLPGESLYISSAMGFDSMQEALPFFDLSAKTAKLKIGDLLGANQGEMALRIGRVLTMAGDIFGSLEAARTYLRTPNFALGGAIPRDLLKTAEGEQLVLSELQTQAAGGPV